MPDILQNWETAAWLVGLPVFLGLIGHFLAIKMIEKLSGAPEASWTTHWSGTATGQCSGSLFSL